MAEKKPRKERSKRRQNSTLNAAPNPTEICTHADFMFVFHLAMNESQVSAYIKAYEVDRESARRHAYKKANQPWVINATNKLRERFTESKIQSAALSREETLGLCARAARTPIIEIDEYDPLCIEYKTETTPFGTVKKTWKKLNPLDGMKLSSQIQGYLSVTQEAIAQAPVDELLVQISVRGIPEEKEEPEERDVTPNK